MVAACLSISALIGNSRSGPAQLAASSFEMAQTLVRLAEQEKAKDGDDGRSFK